MGLLTFAGSGAFADTQKIRFDSWNLSVTAREEIVAQDTGQLIDFEFQSELADDYDYFFAVLDGMENVHAFPLFDFFQLDRSEPFPEEKAIVELKYVLEGNDDFRLLLIDGPYFSEFDQRCLGHLIFSLMTEDELVERDGQEIEAFRHCEPGEPSIARGKKGGASDG